MDIFFSTLAIVCLIKLATALHDYFERQGSKLADKIMIILFVAILLALGWFSINSLGALIGFL